MARAVDRLRELGYSPEVVSRVEQYERETGRRATLSPVGGSGGVDVFLVDGQSELGQSVGGSFGLVTQGRAHGLEVHTASVRFEGPVGVRQVDWGTLPPEVQGFDPLTGAYTLKAQPAQAVVMPTAAGAVQPQPSRLVGARVSPFGPKPVPSWAKPGVERIQAGVAVERKREAQPPVFGLQPLFVDVKSFPQAPVPSWAKAGVKRAQKGEVTITELKDFERELGFLSHQISDFGYKYPSDVPLGESEYKMALGEEIEISGKKQALKKSYPELYGAMESGREIRVGPKGALPESYIEKTPEKIKSTPKLSDITWADSGYSYTAYSGAGPIESFFKSFIGAPGKKETFVVPKMEHSLADVVGGISLVPGLVGFAAAGLYTVSESKNLEEFLGVTAVPLVISGLLKGGGRISKGLELGIGKYSPKIASGYAVAAKTGEKYVIPAVMGAATIAAVEPLFFSGLSKEEQKRQLGLTLAGARVGGTIGEKAGGRITQPIAQKIQVSIGAKKLVEQHGFSKADAKELTEFVYETKTGGLVEKLDLPNIGVMVGRKPAGTLKNYPRVLEAIDLTLRQAGAKGGRVYGSPTGYTLKGMKASKPFGDIDYALLQGAVYGHKQFAKDLSANWAKVGLPKEQLKMKTEKGEFKVRFVAEGGAKAKLFSIHFEDFKLAPGVKEVGGISEFWPWSFFTESKGGYKVLKASTQWKRQLAAGREKDVGRLIEEFAQVKMLGRKKAAAPKTKNLFQKIPSVSLRGLKETTLYSMGYGEYGKAERKIRAAYFLPPKKEKAYFSDYKKTVLPKKNYIAYSLKGIKPITYKPLYKSAPYAPLEGLPYKPAKKYRQPAYSKQIFGDYEKALGYSAKALPYAGAPYAPLEGLPYFAPPYKTAKAPPYKPKRPPYRIPPYAPPYAPPKKPLYALPYAPQARQPGKTIMFFGKSAALEPSLKKMVAGFKVMAKVKGQWKTISPFPLEKQTALALGGRFVGRTPAASFKLAPAKTAGVRLKLPAFRAKEFRQQIKKGKYVKSGVYIEKNLYRIDQDLEKSGISLKGLQSLRKKKKKRKRG